MKNEKREAKEEEIELRGKIRIMIMGKGGKFSVWIEGAKKLLLCLSHTVRILLDKEILNLEGKKLVCVTYVGGAIEITGYIEAIRFEAAHGE